MNLWSLLIYSALLLIPLTGLVWFGKGAVKSVGVYYFSRAVVNSQTRQAHSLVCDDPQCPATALFSAIEDTHHKVRTEAILAVVESLVIIAAAAYTLVFFTTRLA